MGPAEGNSMNRVRKKLHNYTGESIAETLVAVLIIALALTILAGMITTTTRLVKTSEDKLNSYYEANLPLETRSSNDGSFGVTISVKDLQVASENVAYKKNDVFSKKPVVAYYLPDSDDSSNTNP